METAHLPYGEVYTMENLMPLLKQAKVNTIIEKAQDMLHDTAKAKIMASVGAADIKQTYLALLKTLI